MKGGRGGDGVCASSGFARLASRNVGYVCGIYLVTVAPRKKSRGREALFFPTTSSQNVAGQTHKELWVLVGRAARNNNRSFYGSSQAAVK